jgi:NAD(P)H-dependent flavin oxidoreductase YrpB (nitropropane dioxygenase family)
MARRFSQAISEGDGISLIAQVDSAAAARDAEQAGAEALLVPGDSVPDVRDATSLPVLSFFDPDRGDAVEGADACVVDGDREDDGWLERAQREIGEGYELVVRVSDEDVLVAALDTLDPELFLLAAPASRSAEALEHVLGLLPDVPAGKLAIADVPVTSRDEVAELERAGMDAVIVGAGAVAGLAGETASDR